MNERLLQFIWQFQYFNQHALTTTDDEPLRIIKPGTWNRHQGPDFSAATVKIGNTTWAGNIEIHILSSDWYRHRHPGDRHYANIILHVVWQHDTPVYADNGSLIPCLVLGSRVSRHLLERYKAMMEGPNRLPCQSFLPALDHLSWTAWKERLVAERLESRMQQVLTLRSQTQGHWEEVLWQMLAANIGISVNRNLFAEVARKLPLSLLAKHRSDPLQLEALLMGQANLLDASFTDDYPQQLKKEHTYLSKKYRLEPVNARPAFLRMRPAAFPTIRLSQLAAILSANDHLFSLLKETEELHVVLGLFKTKAAGYWDTHYVFDEPAAFSPKQLGAGMIENIIINTVVPLLFSYGNYNRDDKLCTRMIRWLLQLRAEHNHITRDWKQQGITHHSAFDSQALIELTNHYCSKQRCLDCAVGNKILRS